jgi:hypothetical protein
MAAYRVKPPLGMKTSWHLDSAARTSGRCTTVHSLIHFSQKAITVTKKLYTTHSVPQELGPMASKWKLIPIVAVSGFAGLGYEMVWTRELSVALGTEMMAVLGSVAGFFAGLALGAFTLDGLIRRARSPRIAYAVLEAVIGVWGLISIWLLPAAGRMLPPLVGTDPVPALLWAASFALPALVLLPATTAMGGTLTALERMLTEASGDPRVSAGVYGANTAGAARLGDFYAGALHPLTDLQDVVLWTALGLLAGSIGSAQGRWLVLVVPVGLLVGLVTALSFGIGGVGTFANAAMMVALGLLVAAALRSGAGRRRLRRDHADHGPDGHVSRIRRRALGMAGHRDPGLRQLDRRDRPDDRRPCARVLSEET